MKAEFNLTHLSASKDPLTDRITFAETIEFRLWMLVAASCLVSFHIVNIMDIELTGWQGALLISGMVIGYSFAFLGILFRRSAGKVELSENEIHLHPTKKKEEFPESPLRITEDSDIEIYLVQKLNWFTPKMILQLIISNEGDPKKITIKLGSKKSKEQYLEVLESWYRRGYSLQEFDVSGTRIFKLDRGKNYADVQKIKKEYGISW
jgi:hypothetical protein